VKARRCLFGRPLTRRQRRCPLCQGVREAARLLAYRRRQGACLIEADDISAAEIDARFLAAKAALRRSA